MTEWGLIFETIQYPRCIDLLWFYDFGNMYNMIAWQIKNVIGRIGIFNIWLIFSYWYSKDIMITYFMLTDWIGIQLAQVSLFNFKM